MEPFIAGLLIGAVVTFSGFIYAFKRKTAKPTGKSAKFLAALGG
jgi:hypothetical protein